MSKLGSILVGLALLLSLAVSPSPAQDVVLSEVPTYYWYHGCSPTSGMMLMGYWDSYGYDNLIPGSNSWTDNEAQIKDAIASPGHIADYALFNGIDDRDDHVWLNPVPDMSSINPAGAHANDSLADFMGTSRSAIGPGLRYGDTYSSYMFYDYQARGMEDYAAMRGYSFEASHQGGLLAPTWEAFTREINFGRPTLLNIDTDSDGESDHTVAAIGYRTSNGYPEYGFRSTWEGLGTGVVWVEFRGLSPSYNLGVDSMGTLRPANTNDSGWTATDGYWTNTGNWDGGVPSSQTFTYVAEGATTRVANMGFARFLNNMGTVQLEGGSLDAEQLRNVGTISGNGYLSGNVSNYGTISASGGTLRITGQIDGSGIALVTYDGSMQMNCDGTIGGYLDNAGTFSVIAGRTVTVEGGIYNDGSIVLNQPATFISMADEFVGNFGTGAVTQSAGLHDVRGDLYLGYATASEGTYWLSGSGELRASQLMVGYGPSSTGTLDVTAGGSVSSSAGVIGRYPESTGAVTVDGAGSTWTNSGDLDVYGTLNITRGGVVSNSGSTVGFGGEVTVDGVGSTWTNSGRLDVYGTMDVANGGAVSNGYTFVHYGDVTVDGADSSWTDDLWLVVGENGVATLSITNGAQATSPAFGVVGEYGVGEATVDGIGSMWTSGDFLVGSRYGHGTLNITGGGAVSASFGWIGYDFDNPVHSTGAVTVDGAGSTWTNVSYLSVGVSGDGTLTIINGGQVSNTTGTVGEQSGSTGAVRVNGASSTWINSEDLIVGSLGNGTLDITAGGAVSSSDSYIGDESGSTGQVTVSGVGSTWTNADSLSVGYEGSGTLDIAAGGAVSNAMGYIGSTGAVTVSGAGSTWTNAYDLFFYGDATLNIADGGAVSSRRGYIDHGSGSTGVVTVTGAGSTWTNFDHLYVGRYGSGTLNITDGGAVSNTTGYIGYFYYGSTGVVTVSGAGSAWTNSDDLYVGSSGSGTLDITAGGTVEAGGTTYVARYSGSSGEIHFDNGTLTTGGLLSAADDLSGTGTINTNGLVSDVHLVFDATHGLTQTVTLDGPGQNITVNLDVDGSAAMGVGYTGNGSMHIADGVAVQSTSGYLGYRSGSMGAATVDGAGSTWASSSRLYVGYKGSGTLGIAAGGAVSNSDAYIGSTSAVTVSGAGSTWASSARLYVGYGGGGTLDITNGGAVSSSEGHIGYSSESMSVVTVSGAGSTWANSSDLYVGSSGSGTLNITAGGAVSNNMGYIGYESDSTGAVTVNGAGSTWTNSAYLYVGNEGSGTLNIAAGGAVSNTAGLIGYLSGSTSVVTVSGAGSTWTNSDDLYVGNEGSGTLNIAAGGAVSSDRGYIGDASGSTGVVTVSGAGSTWTNSSIVYVGRFGSGTLDITDGAGVSSFWGAIGMSPGGTGVVTVSGTASTWTNSVALVVGSADSGTLRLHDGGMASAASVIFGSGATLEFGLSGAPVESYLDVGGTAILAGDLDVSLLDGYMPSPSSWFLIVDAGSLTGTFATFTFPNAQEWAIDYDTVAGDVSVGLLGWSPGNFDQDQDIDATDIDLLGDAIRLGSTDFSLFDISADGTTGGTDGVIDTSDLDYLVRFLVETAIGSGTEYGDFNLDGMVDITDLTRLAADYGPGDTWAKGNANRNIDLSTDTTDLTILATYYGQGPADPDAIPEPATLSLLALGGLGLLRRRW